MHKPTPPLTFAKYQSLCLRTKSELHPLSADLNYNDLLHSVLGMASELGEMLAKPKDRKEFGDFNWYFAIGMAAIDMTQWPITTRSDTPLIVLVEPLISIVKARLYYSKITSSYRTYNAFVNIASGIDSYAYAQGWDIQEIWCENIEKLKVRYPDKFTIEHAVERKDMKNANDGRVSCANNDDFVAG